MVLSGRARRGTGGKSGIRRVSVWQVQALVQAGWARWGTGAAESGLRCVSVWQVQALIAGWAGQAGDGAAVRPQTHVCAAGPRTSVWRSSSWTSRANCAGSWPSPVRPPCASQKPRGPTPARDATEPRVPGGRGETFPGARRACVRVSALPPPGCVSSAKALNLAVLGFQPLHSENARSTHLTWLL